jgi:hypothetical protein
MAKKPLTKTAGDAPQFRDKESAVSSAAPSSLGIILCTSKKSEQIELLELDKSGIHVAE